MTDSGRAGPRITISATVPKADLNPNHAGPDTPDDDAVATVPEGLTFVNQVQMPPLEDAVPIGAQVPPVFSHGAAATAGLVRRHALPLTAVVSCVLGIAAWIGPMGGGHEGVAADEPARDQAVASSAQQAVTRSEVGDLLNVAQAPAAPDGERAAQLASAVLLGLTSKKTVGKLTEAEAADLLARAQAILSKNKLRMLREGVLGGVYRVEATEVAGRTRVRLETLNAAVTKDIVADLLTRAAAEGEIDIPASLNTAEGDVDMDTMLFNLVQTSLSNDGTDEGAAAAREMSRRAFAASDARTRDIAGERVYVVQRGDSLAYISLQFYGRPDDYERIFDANRDVLTTVDQIRAGQRLKIPS